MSIQAVHSAGHAASAADAAVWHVRVLGGFELDDGRHCLTRLRSRAAMALVARLAMAPGRAHGREELAALLWPEADEETGRSRLRQTLSLLRVVLEPAGGPPVVQADRRVVKVVPGALWCDAVAFEHALRAQQADLAQALYRGELLPGFYDEWVVDERERLQALVDRCADAEPAAPAAPAAAVAPAAAIGTRQARPRLPQYLTRLVGTDQTGARLLALVQAHRLVSVLGPGGCGKTRLAVEVARLAGEDTRAPRFEPPLFVPLVGAFSAADLLDRLALTLQMATSADPQEALLGALDGRRLLLVLDNAEQLDDGAVTAIAGLVERLPLAHWLVTSRRPLGLDGEREFVLEHLPLPEPEAPLAEVAMNPAVLLFVDRARAHRADFGVTAGQRGALVALVRWLEGLPLAIELAASHARTLGPAELLALLRAAREDREDPGAGLAFLARRGARSGSDPRHASMLEVIAWSWRLLAAPAQHLLGRIALLPAGATLHAAAALGSAGGGRLNLARAQVELDTLVSHSVVRVATGRDGQLRYTPFEPVREYALAVQAPGALAEARAAVLAWLTQWAQALPPTPPLASLRDELPNLMAAFAAAPADGAANDALRLFLLLQPAWGEIAIPAGALDVLDRLLATPALEDVAAAGAHALAAWSFHEAGQHEKSRQHIAAALARPCPDDAMRARVLSRAARLSFRTERNAAAARALIAEALPLARRARQPNTEATLLTLEGHVTTLADRDPARGAEFTRRALALWRESGNRHLVNAGRFNVAINASRAGRDAEVLDEFRALAQEGRALEDWDLASGALDALGTSLMKLRRWPEAAAAMGESLAIAWDDGQIMSVVMSLWNVSPVLARLRQGELAARTMGAAQALWALRFGALDDHDRRDLRRVRRYTRALLGAAAAQAAWQQGAALGIAEAVQAVLQARAVAPSTPRR